MVLSQSSSKELYRRYTVGWSRPFKCLLRWCCACRQSSNRHLSCINASMYTWRNSLAFFRKWTLPTRKLACSLAIRTDQANGQTIALCRTHKAHFCIRFQASALGIVRFACRAQLEHFSALFGAFRRMLYNGAFVTSCFGAVNHPKTHILYLCVLIDSDIFHARTCPQKSI